jgi:hypothetical protein
MGLTFRYLFYWNKLEEKQEWLNLDIFSKLILSLIVGLGSFLSILSLSFLINSIFPNLGIQYSLQNFFVLILTFGTSLTLKFYRSDEDSKFENIRGFFIYTLIISIFLLLITFNYQLLSITFKAIIGLTTLVGPQIARIVFYIFTFLSFLLLLLSYMRLAQWTKIIFNKKLWLYERSIDGLKLLHLF